MATSKVAPPHASTEYRSGVSRATCSAADTNAVPRTRVASSDWWASRNVVSVSASALWVRTRSANFSGPRFSRRSREPRGSSALRWERCGSLSKARMLVGRLPCGRLTVTSAR